MSRYRVCRKIEPDAPSYPRKPALSYPREPCVLLLRTAQDLTPNSQDLTPNSDTRFLASAPAECRRDVGKYCLDDVRVVVDAKLIGDRQE